MIDKGKVLEDLISNAVKKAEMESDKAETETEAEGDTCSCGAALECSDCGKAPSACDC